MSKRSPPASAQASPAPKFDRMDDSKSSFERLLSNLEFERSQLGVRASGAEDRPVTTPPTTAFWTEHLHDAQTWYKTRRLRLGSALAKHEHGLSILQRQFQTADYAPKQRAAAEKAYPPVQKANYLSEEDYNVITKKLSEMRTEFITNKLKFDIWVSTSLAAHIRTQIASLHTQLRVRFYERVSQCPQAQLHGDYGERIELDLKEYFGLDHTVREQQDAIELFFTRMHISPICVLDDQIRHTLLTGAAPDSRRVAEKIRKEEKEKEALQKRAREIAAMSGIEKVAAELADFKKKQAQQVKEKSHLVPSKQKKKQQPKRGATKKKPTPKGKQESSRKSQKQQPKKGSTASTRQKASSKEQSKKKSNPGRQGKARSHRVRGGNPGRR